MTTADVARTTKGESTRDRILDAAERLILARGFTGTSVDDILSETRLTKGAFFYHFKSKGDLALVVVERFWRRDMATFRDYWRRADERTDDPLEAVLAWFEMFEADIGGLEEDMVSCLFASYLYEREQFDVAVLDFIRDSFREWSRLYEERLQKVIDSRAPKVPIAARELAEIAICMIEGGFVLGQSYRDPSAVIRQSRHFRHYLRLLFGD